MHCEELHDLTMAGVTWEVTDVPMVLNTPQRATPAATPNAGAAPAKSDADIVKAAAQIDTQRVAATVVPPIAPVQPTSVATARAMAARPIEIGALNRMIAEFNHPLRATATNTVAAHAAGNPNGMVIITDMPSSDDDASGRILSGAAGELLDKMLAAIGMSRDSVSIVPMLFWRTPGGRTPTREEIDLARPFVDRVLELLTPRLILTLGTMPAAEIGGVNLARAHGVAVDLASGIKMMPIFHPNFLLLKPTAKRDAWTALQTVQNLLKIA